MTSESGSFRDPRGQIHYLNDRVLRTVMPMARADFDFVRSSGLTESLAAAGKFIGESEVEKSLLGDAGEAASLVLEHPRLPFVSYPYEWCFEALKSAALLHLDIQMEALTKKVTLTDATAYNVQFIGAKPVFIDALAFQAYTEGEFWLGHRQFCEQFLNPLLLVAKCGVPFNDWYRGSLEGISADALVRVLPWRSRFSFKTYTNVYLQAGLQQRHTEAKAAQAQSKKLPLMAYEQMLHSFRRWISALQPKGGGTVWADYAGDNSYADEEAQAKREFVAAFVERAQPDTLFDIGCNTGDYSVVALENGAQRVIGFDFDHGALDQAFDRAVKKNLDFLPLLLDATNPSPDLGWRQAERHGFETRARGDAVLALALIHHLAIAKNIPLDGVIDWLVARAPAGVIEFVPKADPMVQRLLALREDLFDGYEQQHFEKLLSERARIIESRTVSASGRTLYAFERNPDAR